MRRISFKTVAVFLTVFLIGLTLQLPSYHQLPQPSHDATYRDAIQNVEAIIIEEPTTQIKNHTSKKQRALVLALELSLNELDLQNESDTAAAAASSLAKSQPQKSRLLIGVLTDPKSLHTIGMAACITWGREVQEFADVIFFVGSCEATKGKQRFPGRVVCLDTPDVYPPQRKVFLLWQYMWKNFANEYEYFMKVDHDTYLNFRGVRSLLATVTTPAYTSQCSYIGMTATGRKEEQGRLGLSGRPYCSGLGYMMNTACLVGLGPHLGDCAASDSHF